MFCIELALQGVRGLPEVCRLPFKPGLNILRTENSDVRSTLVDALFHALYPDPARGSATEGLCAMQGKEARIALTLYGRNQSTLRLLRDAETGAMQLLGFDPTKKQFQLLSSVSQEVAQYVRVQQHLPDDASFERMFMFTPQLMPSRRDLVRTRSGVPLGAGQVGFAPSGPGLPARPTPARKSVNNQWLAAAGEENKNRAQASHASSAAAKSEQIQSLKSQLEQALAHEQAQRELDTLNRKKQELSSRLNRVEQARAEVEKLDAICREAGDLKGVDSGLLERIEQYETTKTKHDEDAARLQTEVNALEQELSDNVPRSLRQDRYFLGGIGGAALTVVLALLLGRPEIAVLNLAGAVVAAGAALRWVSEIEGRGKLEIRLKAAKDYLERQHKQFDLESAVTRRLMAQLSVKDPRTLRAKLEQMTHAETVRDEAKRRLEALLGDANTAEEAEALKRIHQKIEEYEGIIIGHTALLSSETLKKRLAELERADESDRRRAGNDIDREEHDDGDDDDGHDDDNHARGYGVGYGTSLGSGFGSGSGSGSGLRSGDVDRSSVIVQTALDILQLDLDGLTNQIRAPLDALLGILTIGRYRFDHLVNRGALRLRVEEQGTVVAYDTLEGDDLDAVDTALRLTLLERCLAEEAIPVVFDHPFEGWSDEKRQAVNAVLTRLAARTQVLLLTQATELQGNLIDLSLPSPIRA